MDAGQASRTLVMLLRDPFVNDARVLKQAVSLARNGFKVRVIALAEGDLPRREAMQGIEVVRLASRPLNALAERLGWRRRPPVSAGRPARAARPRFAWLYAFASALDGSIFALRALSESLRSGRPDIVHAHNLNVLPAAWLMARLARARLVYDSHEVHFCSVSMRKRPRLWRAAARRVEAMLLRRSDAVITVNEACARAIGRIHRVPRPLAIYNAPRLAESAAQAALAVRAAAGAAPGTPLAVYCGRLQPSRGIEQAIEAAALAPGVHLALLGGGEAEYLLALRRFAAQHGVAERVHFVPPVPPAQVSATIRSADFGLVLIQNAGLSYFLSSPNKLFESLHAGLPVVASRLPEIRAVVARFACGLLVDEASPRAVAEALRALARDAALRARLSAGARAAAQEFNWEREEKKLLDLYATLG